jgi:hypothetical protein
MLSAPHSTCRAASPPTGFLSDYVETRVPCQIRRFGRSGRALPTRLGSGFAAGQRRNLKRKFLDMENAIRTQLRTFGLSLGRVGRTEFETRVRQLVAGDQLIASLID